MENCETFIQCLLFVLPESTVGNVSGTCSSSNGNTTRGFALLPSAVIESDSDTILLFVRNNVEILTAENLPSLKQALEQNVVDVVELIVKKSAEKDVFTSNGTPFFPVSVEAGCEEAVRLLLGKDAAVYKRNFKSSDVCKAIDDKNSGLIEHLLTVTVDIRYRNPFGETLMHLAARRNYNIFVDLLARHLSVVDAKSKDGATPLHLAAREGNLSVVEVLLERGAVVNAKKKDGSTSLFLAVRFRHWEILTLLLKNGADVNVGKYNGLTPLHLAAHGGFTEIVAELSERGALVNASLTYSHTKGVTPLCLAVEEEHCETVSRLLASGADVNIPCYDDQTILKLAIDRQNASIVECILKHSPDLNSKINKKALRDSIVRFGEDCGKIARMLIQHGFTVDAEYENLTDLLHNAISKNYVDVVETLLKSGVNVNTVYHYYDSFDEVSIKSMPLLTAIQNNRNEIVKLLIHYGANINVTYGFDDDLNPVETASNNWEATVILLAHDANYSIEDSVDCDGEEVLYSAIRHNDIDVLGRILSKGAKVDGTSCQSKTPITYAVKQGSLEVLKKLVEFGASVSTRDKDGLTALHHVSDKNGVEVVKYLVENSADLEARCFIGQTPVFKAAKNGYLEVVNEFLKYGARIDLLDSFGRSPLHYALAEGRWQIFDTFLSYTFMDTDFIQRTNILQLLRNVHGDSYMDNQWKKYWHEFRAVKKVLMKHLLKLKTLFPSNEALSLFFEQNVNYWKEREMLRSLCLFLLSWEWYQSDMEKEIDSMKTSNVGASSISFFDILTGDVRKLACYARNSDLMESLNTKDYEKQFFDYGSFLSFQIQKGIFRRELLDQSAKVGHLLFNEFKSLPLDLKEGVLSYLSNTDLQILIHACTCIARAQ